MKWEKIKYSLAGALGGAIVLIIAGFGLGGWVTSSTALQMAEETAEEAVTERLAPICVAQFNQDLDRDQWLNKLKELSSSDQKLYLEKQGWATMPGEEKPDDSVIEECVELIIEM